MFTKMLVLAALLSAGGTALASDASYDQQQFRTATRVERTVRAAPADSAAKSGATTARQCECDPTRA